MKPSAYGIWAIRTAESVFGPAQAWVKLDGKPMTFSTPQEAQEQAMRFQTKTTSTRVRYEVREITEVQTQ